MGDGPETERQRGGRIRSHYSFVDRQRNTGGRFCCFNSVEGRSIMLTIRNKIWELFEDQSGQQRSLPTGPGSYKRTEQMGADSFSFPFSIPLQSNLINSCQLSDTPAFVEVANANSK